MDREHIRLLVLGTVVTLVVAVMVVFLRGNRSNDLVLKIEPIDEASEITVYAGGAVATPGLYTLPAHARVAMLIDQAGLLSNADQAQLQMAAELHDGQQVIVPSQVAALVKGESASPSAVTRATAATPPPVAAMAGPIDVNSATAAQLESLPGIGPAIAQRIIDYRLEHGPFSTLDDLANVKGISARMVDDIRDLATVGP